MITEQELMEIEKRVNAATSGPWYPRATDDMSFMNARYVSTEIGESSQGDFSHDNKRGMSEDEAEPTSVIAITLLQMPRLALTDECDENTLFIAHARIDVPRLVVEVRHLQQRIKELEAKSL